MVTAAGKLGRAFQINCKDGRDWVFIKGRTIHLWTAPAPYVILRLDYRNGRVDYYPYLILEEDA